MVRVSEPRPETKTTENFSTPEQVTEDALVDTLISSNAESTEDQTRMTQALTLM
jgi:hypothetical protein